MMNELGIDVDKVYDALRATEGDELRGHAITILNELIASRRELVQRITASPAERNPVTVWATAVEALRRLVGNPVAVFGSVDPGPVLTRAADWLAAIGPDTIKSPCEVCLKPTSIGCARCDRTLCQIHAARNTKTNTHDGGRLHCD